MTASWRSARRSRPVSTRPRRRGWSRRSPTSSGRGSRSSGWRPLLRDVEMPLVEVLAAMEREGLKLDAERLAEVGAGFEERIATLEKEIHELAEEEFTIGSPAAGRPDPLREAGADPQAPRQDRFLDRRPGPRPDPRGAPDRREDRVLARADQAEEHLPRLAARPDRPRHRAHPHDLQPDHGGDRAPLEHQPEPAEHPDPDRDRPSGARLLRRREGRPAALRRLQPGRAAGPRRGRRARRSSRRSSGPATTSTRRPPPRSSTSPARRSTSASARRRRWSTSGSSTG